MDLSSRGAGGSFKCNRFTTDYRDFSGAAAVFLLCKKGIVQLKVKIVIFTQTSMALFRISQFTISQIRPKKVLNQSRKI